MVTSNLTVVIEGLQGAVADTVRRLVFEVVAILAGKPSDGGTPVDTGWARSNWIASTGAPALAAVGTRATVDLGSQQAALAKIFGYKLSDGPAFVTNNVPYILHLNEGSSKQAPRAFVQRAILRAVKTVSGGKQ